MNTLKCSEKDPRTCGKEVCEEEILLNTWHWGNGMDDLKKKLDPYLIP